MASNYTVALIHGERGAYGISFPDFPGAASGGSTVDEAVSRGKATLDFHVTGMVEDGESLPLLRDLEAMRLDDQFQDDSKDAAVVLVPVELPSKAVRVNLSIEERLLDAIDREAKAVGMSRSAFLATAARRMIGQAA